MEYLTFIFSGFWVFTGCFLVIILPLQLALKMWIIFWRHMSIRKHGYPTGDFDADGECVSSDGDSKDD